MLEKKQLRKIAVPKLYKNQLGTLSFGNTDYYIIRTRFERKGSIMVVAVYPSFLQSYEIPIYTIYLHKDDYTTLDRSSSTTEGHSNGQNLRGKWRRSSLRRIFDSLANRYRSGREHQIIFANEKDCLRLERFLSVAINRTRFGIVNAIACYQEEIRRTQLNRKKEIQFKEVNNFMKNVSNSLPKPLRQWVIDTPFKLSRYLIYKRLSKNKATVRCTHCKQESVMIDIVPKHKEPGVCPACRSEVTYIAEGRLPFSMYDETVFSILNKTKDEKQIVIRTFSATLTHRKSDIMDPTLRYHETTRVFCNLDGGITDYYFYGYNSYTNMESWYPNNMKKLSGYKRYCYSVFMSNYKDRDIYMDQYLYPHNIRSTIRVTNLVRNPVFELAKNIKVCPVSATEGFEDEVLAEISEKLFKTGLKNLSLSYLYSGSSSILSDYAKINSCKRKLHQKLGISKKELVWLRSKDADGEVFKCIKTLTFKPTEFKYIEFFSNLEIAWGNITELIRVAPLNFEKIKKYLESHFDTVNHCNVLSTWLDYLRTAKALKWSLWYPKILFPTNLREAHDKVVDMYEEIKDADIDKKIRARAKTLRKMYEYQSDGFSIHIPESYDDFAREVKVLKNCLISAGYYRRHAEEEITILFLRRESEPENPFLCFELTNKEKITQIEGVQRFNYRTPDRQRPTTKEEKFLEKWQKVKCKKKTASLAYQQAA